MYTYIWSACLGIGEPRACVVYVELCRELCALHLLDGSEGDYPRDCCWGRRTPREKREMREVKKRKKESEEPRRVAERGVNKEMNVSPTEVPESLCFPSSFSASSFSFFFSSSSASANTMREEASIFVFCSDLQENRFRDLPSLRSAPLSSTRNEGCTYTVSLSRGAETDRAFLSHLSGIGSCCSFI